MLFFLFMIGMWGNEMTAGGLVVLGLILGMGAVPVVFTLLMCAEAPRRRYR
jgi:hypothetical protein